MTVKEKIELLSDTKKSLSDRYIEAVHVVDFVKKQLGDVLPASTNLAFYGLFKQIEMGDCKIPQPPIYNQVARFKWSAWKKHEGKKKEDVQQQYIAQTIQTLKDMQSQIDKIYAEKPEIEETKEEKKDKPKV